MFSGVVVDIAAFKVSHSIGFDIDATALRDALARSSSIGAMERDTWVRFAGKLTTCHKTHIAKVSIPVGRWYMRGFDFAPALTAFCHNTPQTVSIPVGRWNYTWVRFAGKLTDCQTHTWQQSAHQWGNGTFHLWVQVAQTLTLFCEQGAGSE